MDFKRKILVPTALLVLLVMGISTGVIYYLSSRAMGRNAQEQTDLLVKSRAEIIDLWINKTKALMGTSAERIEYRTVLKKDSEENRTAANASLVSQLKHMEGIYSINITNAQGEVQASTKSESIGKIKINDRDYFKKAMQGEVVVSDVVIARSTGKPSFIIAAPIRDGDRVIGVFYAVPDLEKFSQTFIDPIKVFETGYLYLYTAEGIIFVHKDKSLIMKLKMSEYDFGREMLRQKQGHIRYVFKGEDKMGSFEPCKSVPWTVANSAPSKEVFSASNNMSYSNLGIMLLGFILIILILFFIVRSVVDPLHHISEGLDSGAGQVSSAAAQVSSASQSLAEGATEQAAGLEETSASMAEMASMTQQNAGNAGQANILMRDTRQVVDEANQAMKELIRSMQEITLSSEETGKIIKTIDEIAFQTNLLALNAAVEAARAGEAGAGFAVVADEVRNLALRAAEAAQNTSHMIDETVKKIKKGSEVVGRTNQSFEKLVDGSKKVSDLVDEIAVASQEQSQGISQINKAHSEMDRVVQNNASNAEETASAAEELNAQAQQMKGYVGELLGIIDGKKNGNGNGSHHFPAYAKKEKNVPGLGYQAKVKQGLTGSSSYGRRSAAVEFKEVSPKKVIPFDEEDFKEF
jgi:methyl-accepting chemotaxis protein